MFNQIFAAILTSLLIGVGSMAHAQVNDTEADGIAPSGTAAALAGIEDRTVVDLYSPQVGTTSNPNVGAENPTLIFRSEPILDVDPRTGVILRSRQVYRENAGFRRDDIRGDDQVQIQLQFNPNQ